MSWAMVFRGLVSLVGQAAFWSGLFVGAGGGGGGGGWWGEGDRRPVSVLDEFSMVYGSFVGGGMLPVVQTFLSGFGLAGSTALHATSF